MFGLKGGDERKDEVGGVVKIPKEGEGSERPTIEHVWPHVAPILNDVAEKMKRLMDNFGVSEREMSALCRRFETAAELADEFEGYFNGLLDEDGDGNEDEASGEDVSETDSVGDNEEMDETVEAIAEGIKL